MKSRMFIVLSLAVAALAVVGCEDKKYIVAPDQIPATPTGVYSVTGDGFVDIYWPVNNDDGITEAYAVYYYVRTEGNQEIYELLADGNEIDIRQPDLDVTDVVLAHYRDTDVENGVTYWYAVSAYNDNGESDLSIRDAEDTPRPQGDRTIDLDGQELNRLGWEFSPARTRPWNSIEADVFFEYDSQLGAFFIWANRDDVFLQDFGYSDSLKQVDKGEPGVVPDPESWGNVGWVELSPRHAYIIAMGEEEGAISEHYAAIRILGLDFEALEVDFEWAYQTDTFNPELKRAPESGNYPSSVRYVRRSGN